MGIADIMESLERTVRNFKLVEQIGTGGMGVIYRAIQTTLDRPVAFKELHPHLAKDAEFIRRFEREAKTAATLQHENIVHVIDFGKEGESYFIAMEFVDGGDLKQMLAHEPKLLLPVAVTFALDILKGLEHAHARGIVHRDLKPANLMVTREGCAKIADFSVAQAQTMSSVTMTGAMMGTPAYMSPEQIGGRPLDARTDLFSMGVILFDVLAGRRPFEGDTYPAVITNLLTVVPPPLHQIDPLVPESIARVVRKALEKDADRRYQTASDFARELENAAREEKIEISRALVAEFLKDPKGYPATVRRRQAKEAFQQGLFLMNQGLTRIDDAIRALEKVVHLEPTNAEARKHLELLRQRKGSGPKKKPEGRTPAPPPAVPSPPAPATQSPAGTQWRWIAGAAAGAGMVLAGIFGLDLVQGSRTTAATVANATRVAVAPPAAATPVVAPPADTTPETAASAFPLATAPLPAASPADPPPIASPTAAAARETPTKPAVRARPTPTVKVALAPPRTETPAEPIADAFLKIVVVPNVAADLYVDEEYVAKAPLKSSLRITTGKHLLTVSSPGFAEYSAEIQVKPGANPEHRVTLTPR